MIQAEDGIRDKLVTGVQTCALPISVPQTEAITAWLRNANFAPVIGADLKHGAVKVLDLSIASPLLQSRDLKDGVPTPLIYSDRFDRSEERRVGKECRLRWSAYDSSRRRHTR